MFDTLERIFISPLGREFCDYYYYWTVFLVIVLLIVTVTNFLYFINGKLSLLHGVLSLLPSAFIYLHYRLLYSMCSKSL